jgi:hypothetical protein
LIDWGVVIAVLVLAVWAAGTLLGWGGWVHALLTAGVFMLVWAIVRRNKLQIANRKMQK